MARTASWTGPDRRLARPSPVVVGLAVLGAAAIAFVTFCPIGMRPHLASPDAERFAAFFVLGGLIALAAGRRWVSATVAVVALAFAFEAGQLIIPGRDAMLSDAIVKALGGVCGCAVGQAFFALRRLVLRLSVVAARRRTPVSASAG
ncbi:VanZ family protein [Phenylobacterium sp.]|uniref:VanZ family protein n=1 Tax=Phenylobacterium sp. TaxID=1871053 RepID=UPI00374C9904